jgi:hypothetical protein
VGLVGVRKASSCIFESSDECDGERANKEKAIRAEDKRPVSALFSWSRRSDYQTEKLVNQLERGKTKISSEVLRIWINIPEYAELRPDFSILSTNRTSRRKTNFQDTSEVLSLEYMHTRTYI